MNDLNGKPKNNWVSVSGVIKKFYEPFDSEGIADRKAKGDPIEKARLLKEWSDAGDYSTNLGSRTHYLLEKKSCFLPSNCRSSACSYQGSKHQ